MKKQTMLVIDDHPLFREGVKVIVKRSNRFEIIGNAGTAFEGLALAKKLQPDIITLDLSLPDKNGLEIMIDLLESCPKSKVVIISMHSQVDYIAESFQCGASGYIIKEAASENLLQGLDAIADGENYIDTRVAVEVLQILKNMPVKTARKKDDIYGALTPREQQIMRLLAEGYTSKEIGAKLFISHKTVENHRTNIMKKLNLQNTIELVRYAVKLGLVDVELWKG